MADLADVMDALASIAASAVYPTPTTTITGKAIDIGQGWPLAEDVDAAMKAGTSIVSVYNVPGSGGRPSQVMDFSPAVLKAPVHNIVAAVSGTTVTFSVATGATSSLIGDVTAVVVDYSKIYAHRSDVAETPAQIATALRTQVLVDYPLAAVSGGALTVPNSHSLEARVGSTGTLGQKVHRQTDQFRIVVWSPNPADRTTIARNIDVAIKREVRVTMPDTSSAIITIEGANLSDKEENEGVYRRDLMVSALYDTIDEISGTEVIGVQVQNAA